MHYLLYILLPVFSIIVLSPASVSAQSGCAQIESVTVDTSTIRSGQPYKCQVNVAPGSAGDRSIGCGVSFDGGYPLDFCPSDQFFGGWSGNTATFNCVFPNTNISSSIKKVEMVGWDFECDAAQGKRVEVTLERSTPDPNASGSASASGSAGVDPSTQEPAARSMLSNLLNAFYGAFSGGGSSSGGSSGGSSGNGSGSGSGSGNPAPVPKANLANAAEYSERVINDIRSVCNADGVAGRVTAYNQSCLNATSFTPNARTTAQNNARNYTYLQCFGMTQSLWAAINGDIPEGSNPFLGHMWPTNLITAPRGGITARFNAYPISSCSYWDTISNAYSSKQGSCQTCQQVADTNDHLIIIWGTPGATNDQHIASGVFSSSAKDMLHTWEGNTDYKGVAAIKNRPTSGGFAPKWCLIQKN